MLGSVSAFTEFHPLGQSSAAIILPHLGPDKVRHTPTLSKTTDDKYD